MAASTPVTGYDPASHRVVTMDVTPADQDVPTEHEYLEDMIQLWQRKQRKSPPKTPKLKGTPAASQPAFAGMSTNLLPGGAPNSYPPQAPRKPAWRPRYTPRIGRDDLIVVLKPRASFDLKTVLPSERAGDAVRAFLGDCSAADLHVWPVWDQNVLVCSLTSIPIAQRLLGDIMLPVGDQQLPFRGHAKASGDICRGVINIDPAASSSSIKPNLEWPKGTILAARKLGDSNVAVVTFEGPKVPRFIFYRCQVAYVRLYKKTVPVCSCCGTIGHRATACPSPKPGFCSRCGSQVPTTPEGLAQHDCQPRCILCTGPHETGARGCPGKYRKPIKPSQPVSSYPASPLPRTPHQGHAPLTQPKSGSRSKAPPPATPEHFPPLAAPPQVSSWAGVASRPLPSIPSAAPTPLELTLQRQNSELQRQVAALAKQLESLRSQLLPPQPKSALPLASVAVSPNPNPSSSSPPGPPSQEHPQTRAVAAAVSQDPSSALPPIQVPLDDLPPIDTTLPIQDRLTGLEQRSLTMERALRALPDLLIQRIGETIVPKITAEVLKAVQIWACSQFRFKKSRSRSASPNATPRRRKLVGTANTPFNPVLIPPSPAPPVPDPVLVPVQAMEDDP
ncbi:hypothetical protein HPB49_014324 [Dermacentor silvarum]|uniref:Uncharacterized protein n=1 Tax=Dermacentor silvarum TaxID=543639 RepID=A0ACB8CLA5_DERSI|nr:hypothetical protein HPB49_014324 [Dermacentor silvarum]